jgi:hypothetical protein
MWTDMAKLTGAFHDFANVPKNDKEVQLSKRRSQKNHGHSDSVYANNCHMYHIQQ